MPIDAAKFTAKKKQSPTTKGPKVPAAAADDDRSTLPFRDALFASRAIRLMQIGEANRCPQPATTTELTTTTITTTPEREDREQQQQQQQQEEQEQCGPWFVAVGFSLPHEPVRMPKYFWDLYDDDDDDIVDTATTSRRSTTGTAERERRRRKEAQAVRGSLPVRTTPHPRRPVGSPLFAFGDLKERFVYYEEAKGGANATTAARTAAAARAGSRKENVRANYGPTKPVYSKEGKATAPRRAVGPSGAVELGSGGDGDGGGGRGEGGRGRGRGRGREGVKEGAADGVDSAVNEEAAAVLSSFVRGSASSSSSSPAEPPPLPPPDLSLLMTAEEVAAIRGKRGNLGAAYAEALTKRSKQRHRASPPSSYEEDDLEMMVEENDFWAQFAATGSWVDPLDRIHEAAMPEEMQYQLQRGYSAAVSSMDHQLGRVLDALAALPGGAVDRTVVVFTSDHGYGRHQTQRKGRNESEMFLN